MKVITKKNTIPRRFRSSNAEEEAKINLAVRSCFSGTDGDMVLSYLQNVTFNTILEPDTHSEKHLWMQEGAKALVWTIQERIKEAS
ncbi:MAG: hypothetical protein CME71_11805 [Halobacteriovorax sp.]|nr:hypothetical protein [Halobacteriovorax sp.]|tara:strand:- start:10561 stop:10818 length:258 start_codon:yes stop_codon:yes gene_type:complete